MALWMVYETHFQRKKMVFYDDLVSEENPNDFRRLDKTSVFQP